jgi:hypothetical protein
MESPAEDRERRARVVVPRTRSSDLCYDSCVLGLVVFSGILAAALAEPGRCGTTALRSLPDSAVFAIGVTDRPEAVDFVDSDVIPVRVHRTRTATPEQVAVAISAAEAAWTLQVDGAGFPPPLPDDEGFDAAARSTASSNRSMRRRPPLSLCSFPAMRGGRRCRRSSRASRCTRRPA